MAKKIQIKLAFPSGRIDHEGYEICPGLAVCKVLVSRLDGKGGYKYVHYEDWQILHIPSGLRIGQTFRLLKHAKGAAEAIADLTDWTVSAEMLAKLDLSEVRRILRDLVV